MRRVCGQGEGKIGTAFRVRCYRIQRSRRRRRTYAGTETVFVV